MFGLHLGIRVEPVILAHDLQRFLEQSVIEAEDHVRVHLDEPAVAVPRKAGIAACFSEPLHRLVVEAEVEDRVHHAGHRDRRARADRDEQRVRRIAQLFAHGLFDMRDAFGHRILQPVGEVAAQVEIAQALFGRDRESGRDRQADARHFGKVRALAAGDGLVLLARVRMVRIAAEVVDCLGHGDTLFLVDQCAYADTSCLRG